MNDRKAIPWESLFAARVRAEPLERARRYASTPVAKHAIDLASQQPSLDLLPRERLRLCIDHVLDSPSPTCLGYVQNHGVPELRAAIARDLGADGIRASADDVVVTTGSQQGLDLLVRTLVDPGDPFLVETQTYPGTLQLLALAEARLLAVPCDDEGPDMDALGRLATQRPKGLYLMPQRGNPTGVSISAARREELVGWSRASGVPLVEDDYDADLDLDERPMPPRLRAIDEEVCHVGTYSKRLMPSLRLGYVVCPPAIRAHLVAIQNVVANGASGLLQRALAEFLDRGYLREHVVETTREYRVRRDALESTLREALPADVEWERPSRGLFLWIRLPDGLSAEDVHREASRRGVRVTPGALYGAGEGRSHAIRATYCRERPERLVEGARRLAAAIDDVRAQRVAGGTDTE